MESTNWRENFSFFKIFTLMMVTLLLLTYYPQLTPANSSAMTPDFTFRVAEINHINKTPPRPTVITKFMKEQIDCLATTIYHEAGSEPFLGKLAVAQVVINRVNHGGFGHSICQVVYQKTATQGQTVCQFSWACDSSIPAIPRFGWLNSLWIAKLAYLKDKRISELKNALYFHTVDSHPGWHLRQVAQIGHHVFYEPY